MSRSILKNKYIRTLWKGRSNFAAKANDPVRNTHRQDEAPKNRPSKLVLNHCSADVDWLQDSTSFGGHSRPSGGHRRVSGLVRASLKEEERKVLEESLSELDSEA